MVDGYLYQLYMSRNLNYNSVSENDAYENYNSIFETVITHDQLS